MEWAGGELAGPGRKERRGQEEGGLGQGRKRESFLSFFTQTHLNKNSFEIKHKLNFGCYSIASDHTLPILRNYSALLSEDKFI